MEHSGHRQRLLKKFNDEILSESEQLEILLFNAMPRRNTSDIAHRLLARFGSIEGVLVAPMSALKEVDGLGNSLASYLRIVGTYLEKGLRSVARRVDGTFASEEFIKSIRPLYENLETETLTAYCIDKTGKVFKEYRFTDEKEGGVQVSSRELVWLLHDSRPMGIVLVHNHPDGGVDPSEQDDESTKKAESICFAYGVAFYDHVIFANGSHYSYYVSGRLPLLERENLDE